MKVSIKRIIQDSKLLTKRIDSFVSNDDYNKELAGITNTDIDYLVRITHFMQILLGVYDSDIASDNYKKANEHHKSRVTLWNE